MSKRSDHSGKRPTVSDHPHPLEKDYNEVEVLVQYPDSRGTSYSSHSSASGEWVIGPSDHTSRPRRKSSSRHSSAHSHSRPRTHISDRREESRPPAVPEVDEPHPASIRAESSHIRAHSIAPSHGHHSHRDRDRDRERGHRDSRPSHNQRHHSDGSSSSASLASYDEYPGHSRREQYHHYAHHHAGQSPPLYPPHQPSYPPSINHSHGSYNPFGPPPPGPDALMHMARPLDPFGFPSAPPFGHQPNPFAGPLPGAPSYGPQDVYHPLGRPSLQPRPRSYYGGYPGSDMSLGGYYPPPGYAMPHPQMPYPYHQSPPPPPPPPPTQTQPTERPVSQEEKQEKARQDSRDVRLAEYESKMLAWEQEKLRQEEARVKQQQERLQQLEEDAKRLKQENAKWEAAKADAEAEQIRKAMVSAAEKRAKEAAEDAAKEAAKKAKEESDKALGEAKKKAEEFEAAKKALEADAKKASEKEQGQILFEDAIGRKYTLPFAVCKTWGKMEQLIRQAFANHPEGPRVDNGHYDLAGPNEEIILPEVWDQVVKPDWKIKMHLWPLPQRHHGHGPPGHVDLPFPFDLPLPPKHKKGGKKDGKAGKEPKLMRSKSSRRNREEIYDVPMAPPMHGFPPDMGFAPPPPPPGGVDVVFEDMSGALDGLSIEDGPPPRRRNKSSAEKDRRRSSALLPGDVPWWARMAAGVPKRR